jgi:hypothetical protein
MVCLAKDDDFDHGYLENFQPFYRKPGRGVAKNSLDAARSPRQPFGSLLHQTKATG